MKRYTSDLHLKHDNILIYDNRPFDNIEYHDKHIIDTINEYVSSNDQLYILWDISWKANQSIELLSQIKCKHIFYVQWNHDFTKYTKLYDKLWWTNLWLLYHDKESKLVLCHYPLEERYRSRHKDWANYLHLHWHSHNNLMTYKDWRIDIWFTFKNLNRPVSLDDINLLFRS